jgi:hypothetical protein
MNKPKRIQYTPRFQPEDLRNRLIKLSKAFEKALHPLQCFQDCGADEIANEEASYIQEMRGFVELVQMMAEELAGAVNSVNRAFYEVEEVEFDCREIDDHPWLDEYPDGYFDTTIFKATLPPFCGLMYNSPPEKTVEKVEPEFEWPIPLPPAEEAESWFNSTDF